MNYFFKTIYYRFNAWRYGMSYGCGRCHHAQWLHGNRCIKCFCTCYVIERKYYFNFTGNKK